jgi:hypothetical protein
MLAADTERREKAERAREIAATERMVDDDVDDGGER